METKITDVQIYPLTTSDNRKAIAKIVINDCLAIFSIKVIEINQKLEVVFPVDHFSPISGKFRQYIKNQVLSAYSLTIA